jgi:hypothetical protein
VISSAARQSGSGSPDWTRPIWARCWRTARCSSPERCARAEERLPRQGPQPGWAQVSLLPSVTPHRLRAVLKTTNSLLPLVEPCRLCAGLTTAGCSFERLDDRSFARAEDTARRVVSLVEPRRLCAVLKASCCSLGDTAAGGQPPTGGPAQMMCMVCDHELAHLSATGPQRHVNGCLEEEERARACARLRWVSSRASVQLH